jgi:hypothetical protein
MPRLILHIIPLFLLLAFVPAQKNYDELFAEDYTRALRFLKINLSTIQKTTVAKKNDVALLTSTVFPELVRYSFFKDLLETGALELMYVDHGAPAADFSMGGFQMKPSFAEDLENTLSKNDSLAKVYSCLFTFKGKTEKERRRERLTRLKSLSWQLAYANCFVSVMNLKYKDKLFTNPEEKIKFYACAYNSGFHRKETEIEKIISIRQFPYGKNYTGEQYAYSDVSGYFFKKNFPALITQLSTPSAVVLTKANHKP